MKLDFSYSSTSKTRFENLVKSENLGLLIFGFAVFFIPFIFGHSTNFPNQLIVGSLVNTLLASSALHLTMKKSLPIILLPAIAAVLSGFIFGSFSIFLAFLVPFIWIGNAIYVYFIKNLKIVNKMNYAGAVFISSLLKALFLFLSTLALVYLAIIPEIFLLPMSLVQFATAMAGGLIGGITLLKN
ncbi:MAG: hypothetical protein CL944_00320 [Candidatus Diapherotrites archaeon]|uniref:ECF transporter S component n=1 Tax=Candidatus Iainarchaeum sp. TaxID=3101447 RepID=A0A2D6LP05_9ARCH|nr:hypothetical protein [Candidatus Diapherotrites archaeon]